MEWNSLTIAKTQPRTQPVLKIVPEDSLIAEVFIQPEDIGFVRENMATDIRITAFPFGEYGDVKGKVAFIGKNALEPEPPNNFFRYRAEIELERSSVKFAILKRVTEHSAAEEYADDFLFGFCVTDTTEIALYPNLPPKRDTIFRNNMAVGLSSNINVHLQIAPRNTDNSSWNNIRETTPIYRQVSYTAYQYPFALSRSDCISQTEWTKALLKAIGELSEVAGGNSVSYIQMSPRSIIARLTSRRVPGYDTYGFNEEGEFTELNRLIDKELPGEEFWLGGEIVRQMSEETKQQLKDNNIKLKNNPETLLEELSQQFLKEDNI